MTKAGKRGYLKPSTQFSATSPWDPYWNALCAPRRVPKWSDTKRMSIGVDIARRLWAQREYLRRTYEYVHGADPDGWPSQHPGVVVEDEVLSVAHAACLRCQWLDAEGPTMSGAEGRRQALVLARNTKPPTGNSVAMTNDRSASWRTLELTSVQRSRPRSDADGAANIRGVVFTPGGGAEPLFHPRWGEAFGRDLATGQLQSRSWVSNRATSPGCSTQQRLGG